MQLFIDAASMGWVLSVVLAVVFARLKNFVQHRRWMTRSFGFACVPIAQRLVNFFLTPFGMAAMTVHNLMTEGMNLPNWSKICYPATDCPTLLSLKGIGVAEQVIC
jgi:hypothetical protein